MSGSAGGAGRHRALVAFTRWYDGWELAAAGSRFEADVPLSRFERLSEALGGALVDRDAQVRAQLRFAREGRLIGIQGRCRGSLPVVCQRCLEAFSLPVDSDLSILAVESEGMLAWAAEEEERETVLLEGRVRPLDFIEDELLLSLPLVPTHPDPHDCADLSPWTG